jgi:hypothetical protein
MFRRRVAEYNRFGWVLWGLVLLHATQGGFGAEQTSRAGTLHLAGNGIEFLVLQQDTGRERVLERPDADVVLPEGRYRIQQIILAGGRTCRPGELPGDRWLTVEPNTPATLSLGAPLRQVIAVKRRGSVLDLAYELIGQGGEHYSIDRAEGRRAPAFAVYRGDHQVASGDFEFG